MLSTESKLNASHIITGMADHHAQTKRNGRTSLKLFDWRGLRHFGHNSCRASYRGKMSDSSSALIDTGRRKISRDK